MSKKDNYVKPIFGHVSDDYVPFGIFRTQYVWVGKELVVPVTLSFNPEFMPILTFNHRSFCLRFSDFVRLAAYHGLFDIGDSVEFADKSLEGVEVTE